MQWFSAIPRNGSELGFSGSEFASNVVKNTVDAVCLILVWMKKTAIIIAMQRIKNQSHGVARQLPEVMIGM